MQSLGGAALGWLLAMRCQRSIFNAVVWLPAA